MKSTIEGALADIDSRISEMQQDAPDNNTENADELDHANAQPMLEDLLTVTNQPKDERFTDDPVVERLDKISARVRAAGDLLQNTAAFVVGGTAVILAARGLYRTIANKY